MVEYYYVAIGVPVGLSWDDSLTSNRFRLAAEAELHKIILSPSLLIAFRAHKFYFSR